MNAKETYKKIAEALPEKVQAALLFIRDNEEDLAEIESIYLDMPMNVYFCMVELGLVTDFNETTRSGMLLTKAGRHLVNYCTC